jgi:hypothetical protein
MSWNNLSSTTPDPSGEQVDWGDYPDFAQLRPVRLLFIVIYTVIIVLTVLGNVLVIYTVACQKKMHNSVNYLICNLAGKRLH